MQALNQVGPFRIESELGRGGMGIVYLASQAGLGRKVALKVLDPSLASDQEFVVRFKHEASTLARLDSPHVIAVYDHGEAGGTLYIATQYVTGGDLGTYVRNRGALPRGQALSVFAQLVEALRDAHAAGIIHRDVKPSNILLRGDRAEPYIYLCDFGIAQVTAESGATRTGMVAGSTAYMAPERHEGRPATAKSDLYSAGCVLWVMLTGHTPYGGTEFQQAMAHTQAPIPELPGSDADTALLNQLISWCMAKDPQQRPHDAEQLLGFVDDVRGRIHDQGAAADRTQLRAGLAGPYPQIVTGEETQARGTVPMGTPVPGGAAYPPIGGYPSDATTLRPPPPAGPPGPVMQTPPPPPPPPPRAGRGRQGILIGALACVVALVLALVGVFVVAPWLSGTNGASEAVATPSVVAPPTTQPASIAPASTPPPPPPPSTPAPPSHPGVKAVLSAAQVNQLLGSDLIQSFPGSSRFTKNAYPTLKTRTGDPGGCKTLYSYCNKYGRNQYETGAGSKGLQLYTWRVAPLTVSAWPNSIVKCAEGRGTALDVRSTGTWVMEEYADHDMFLYGNTQLRVPSTLMPGNFDADDFMDQYVQTIDDIVG